MKETKDFLFVFNESSEYAGEHFLVETFNLEEALRILTDDYFFEPSEFKFITTLSVEEGEGLGLDTY